MYMKWTLVTLAAMLVVACGKKEEAAPAANAHVIPVAEVPAPARAALVTYTPTPILDNIKKEAACRSESMEGYGTGIINGQRMSKADEDYATHLIYTQCMSK